MGSHIECDDLLAFASCSVDDQLNADIRNQISMSLLCHIAQANAMAEAPAMYQPYGQAHGASAFAPATTPTATFSSAPSAWLSDETNTPSSRRMRRRNPSPNLTRSPSSSAVPSGSRYSSASSRAFLDERENYGVADPSMMMDDEVMQIEAEHGEYYDPAISPVYPTAIGTSSDEYQADPALLKVNNTLDNQNNMANSLFATSDPFFLAVSERQAASNRRRQLQAKPFAVSTPLQVTPNPVQFGNLNPLGGAFNTTSQAMQMNVNGNRQQFYTAPSEALSSRGPGFAQLDTALLQYR
ncbi:hypothetical protein CPB86DRAFT_869438 [Serendipita vermifera]|nr:hypothetical protein CPB86DRAFT_869438 [Serendipita vermifera]